MPVKNDDKRAQFIDAYLAGMNGTQAAVLAGVPKKSASVMANRWLRTPEIADDVRKGMASRMTRLAPLALGVIEKLMDDPDTPASIRLAAARDVLDRANYLPPKRTDVRLQEVDLQKMTRAELDEYVRQSARQKELEAKTVEADYRVMNDEYQN